MLEWKNTISRVILLQILAIAVPPLTACELRLPHGDSGAGDPFASDDRAAPPRLRGGTNPIPSMSPAPAREPDVAIRERPVESAVPRDPQALALPTEQDRGGPGTSTYLDLLVLDPQSLGGAHSANGDPGAPWSFRAQMAWLAGGDTGALAFTVRWLDAWQDVTSVGTADAPVNARPALRSVLLRPWLGDEGVDDLSTSHDTSEPDDAWALTPVPDAGTKAAPDAYGTLPPDVWAAAPFRLIGIVNRVDLAADACGSAAGELRYVYTATDAAGERALDLSMIVEIPYPSTRSAASWARSWRDVAAQPAGPGRDALLLALTREVTLAADPLRARVRTNEAALSEGRGPWQMREFQLASSSTGELELRQVPLAFTPRADADLGQLAQQLLANSADALAGGLELPDSLRAGTAEMSSADFSWRVPGISERLRSAFSSATCNGCHAGDTRTERFQHIAPGASLGSPARLSRFLYDEDAPTDELRRREALLVQLSTTNCSNDPAAVSGPYEP